MPRASYGDRNTVAVERKDKQLVFDFQSKVIGVLTVDSNQGGVEDPHSLVVLCEEEVVGIDLRSDDWRQFKLPYLLPLHASPITAAQFLHDLDTGILDAIVEAGKSQAIGKYDFSSRQWPINGGRFNEDPHRNARDVLVTG